MEAEKASWGGEGGEVVSSSGWRGRGLLEVGAVEFRKLGACGGVWWTEVTPDAQELLRQKDGVEGQGREGQVALNKKDM